MTKFQRTNFTLRFKRGTEANLTKLATSYTSQQGEPGYATDSKKFMVFDGTTFNIPNLDRILVNDAGEVLTLGGEVLWL